MDSTTSPFMRPPEVAQYLDVSPATLRLWRANGDGPPSFLMQGRVRYVREDVMRWVEQQRRADAAAR